MDTNQTTPPPAAPGQGKATAVAIGVVMLLLLIGGAYLAITLLTEDTADVVSLPPSAATRAVPAPAAVSPAAARPQPAKLLDVPALASPVVAEESSPADAKVREYLSAHNRWQDELGHVVLKGQCQWTTDAQPGRPRPMSITYDRLQNRAALLCGTDRCEVNGPKITLGSDNAMNIDALYVLMFRKYSLRDARNAGTTDGRTIVATSDGEALAFDPQTGRLVAAAVSTPRGTVTAHFEDFAPLPNEAKTLIPTRVWLEVPAAVFPFPMDHAGKVEFRIDPARSEAKPPAATTTTAPGDVKL